MLQIGQPLFRTLSAETDTEHTNAQRQQMRSCMDNPIRLITAINIKVIIFKK